jgi:hypothetical protein
VADPSVAAYAILQNRAATKKQKLAAFERLLQLRRGRWGPSPLMLTAMARALVAVRSYAHPWSIPLDDIDWRRAAVEALKQLYLKAATVQSPAMFLRKAIRDRVGKEVRASDLAAIRDALLADAEAPDRSTRRRTATRRKSSRTSRRRAASVRRGA